MKKIKINLNYKTNWGESIKIVGSIPQLGIWNKDEALSMYYINNAQWSIDLEIPIHSEKLEFRFFINKNDVPIKTEELDHIVPLSGGDATIACHWLEKSNQSYFHTSMFPNSVFRHNYENTIPTKNIILLVDCIHVDRENELVICGKDPHWGGWEIENAIALKPIAPSRWFVELDDQELLQLSPYKYGIRCKKTKQLIEWEEGENRRLEINSDEGLSIIEQKYNKEWIDWKASGVAIPVFSIRSDKSFGIGEFSDLNLLIDFAEATRMKIIQTLPINDTTASHSWSDSYPYNAISIYALHPIYLGLAQYPLEDKKKNNKYLGKAKELNELAAIDYPEVIKLKTEYIAELYKEMAEATLESDAFTRFYEENKEWLFSYAAFCYLRDTYQTANHGEWKEYSKYNEQKLTSLIKNNDGAKASIYKSYFTQFLLRNQLLQAKEYAHSKGVILKGDIPIGISPNSVEAWTEPHLFNMDCQTGAPPDDFSVNGQNWGFPTYNWAEMEKDNYRWWSKRFQKMADYFDAYRIDHILGFFRIWEIPKTSVHGLLGYFSPALPLSAPEIQGWGYPFDETEDCTASIHKDDLHSLFGKYSKEAASSFLTPSKENWYVLKKEVSNQLKIKILFDNKTDEKSSILREGLYTICNEVLFVRDKYQTDKFHPRISIDKTLIFYKLENNSKEKLYNLYQDFFYYKHSSYWKDEATRKLPTLLGSTNMLVCGEDLGMVPQSVPLVMQDLQILSLEIQRMPKKLGTRFSDLSQLPHLSVVTTSTHDMPPLRMWWEEDKEAIQQYYNQQLSWSAFAPLVCNTTICAQIIRNHLRSPAMLAVLPFQDWLSISDKLRRVNCEDERINVPSNPKHHWNYRMHIYMEDLLEEKEFADTLKFLNIESGR